MKFDPKVHHRRSIRLKGYDYSQAGAYFVTIVAWQRECLFGEIVGGGTLHECNMVLNELGEIVREEWERTAFVRPNVELGEYIIMPNHVHGILVFVDDMAGATRVGASRRLAPTKTTLQPNSLGSVIGQFKSIVTKRINGLQNVTGRPVWQRNYYEHIIRDEPEMNRIARYIESNPLRWADDDENPNRIIL
jgi:REP element-mobilizing transposase RayT